MLRVCQRLFRSSRRLCPLVRYMTQARILPHGHTQDVEVLLAKAETMTARPPTRGEIKQAVKSKTISHIQLTPEIVSAFRCYPQLDGLPTTSFRSVTAEAIAADLAFKKFDEAHNFVSLFLSRLELPEIKIYRLLEWDENRQVSKVKLAMVLEIPEDVRSAQFKDVTRIVSVGEGKSPTLAKKAARIDLAERLFRVIDDPNPFLSAKKAVKPIDEYHIKVNLKATTRKSLEDAIDYIEETQPFHADTNMKNTVGMSLLEQQRRPIKLMGRKTIEALPLPKRLEGHKLPVCQQYKKIIDVIDKNRVTIVSAATGSGKTTQIPQFILDQFSGTDERPNVIVTQPRRIAAKSVAKRIAEERGERIEGGQSAVGYSVRFETLFPRRTEKGSILFCTSGVLLRRLQNDPMLGKVSHLILDEVHERDVFTDLLLLISRRLLKRRPDLKLILMSATMPIERISRYFESDGLSVGKTLDVEGTNYPVQENYLTDVVQLLAAAGEGKYVKMLGDVSDDCKKYVEYEVGCTGVEPSASKDPTDALIIEENELKPIPYEIITALIKYINAEKPPGAILCFLPGWEELQAVYKLLAPILGDIDLHLVHSTSPANSADSIFRPPPEGRRKVILATNIAESSITIPDVVYVIDSGKQKIMHYDQRHRMNMLESSWISKANLRQRLGRAGRCKPGEYYSMISHVRAESLPDQTPPELLRLGLDEVCLGLKAMGINEPCQLVLSTAVDPPNNMAVRQSIDQLITLGAMNTNESLTPLGKFLSNIPVNPGISVRFIFHLLSLTSAWTNACIWWPLKRLPSTTCLLNLERLIAIISFVTRSTVHGVMIRPSLDWVVMVTISPSLSQHSKEYTTPASIWRNL